MAKMPKKEETVEQLLEDAKELDFDIVLVLGLTEEGESHFMYNCEEHSALQIMDLFRANFFAEILKEALNGSSGKQYH